MGAARCLLCDDPAAQEFYRQFIALDVDLAWRGAARAARVPSEAAMREHLSGEVDAVAVAPIVRRRGPSPLSPLPSPLLVRQPNVRIHGCRVDLGGWDRRCRLWNPAAASQLVVEGAVLPPVETAADSGPVIVGTITGMSNCRWADPRLAACVADPVPQGRKYPMASGLLEITYNTGAKVIIEGPAIYAADACNGGVLFFGKLTAITPEESTGQSWKTAKKP